MDSKPNMRGEQSGSDRSRVRHGPLYWLAITVALVFLLALPIRAILALTANQARVWALAYLVAVSTVTLAALASDKSKARQGQWRIPERTLHFLELAGGWPASFMGQKIFHHKTRKSEYQFAFWSIIVLHQYAAIDVMHGWRWTKHIIEAAKPWLERIS